MLVLKLSFTEGLGRGPKVGISVARVCHRVPFEWSVEVISLVKLLLSTRRFPN